MPALKDARGRHGSASTGKIADEKMDGAEESPDRDVDDADTRVVIRWLRNTLREWENTITARPAEEQNTTSCKVEKGQFRQCKQYLRPLRKKLQERGINPAIVRQLATIAEHSN